jgi:HK97 family phage prohead protease
VNEYRAAALVGSEVKGRTLHGYAATFDSPWNKRLVEARGYVETIRRGAFRKALGRSDNVPLLWQHERRDMLATTGAGTLRLKEDGRGLYFEADLPENPLGEYVL